MAFEKTLLLSSPCGETFAFKVWSSDFKVQESVYIAWKDVTLCLTSSIHWLNTWSTQRPLQYAIPLKVNSHFASESLKSYAKRLSWAGHGILNISWYIPFLNLLLPSAELLKQTTHKATLMCHLRCGKLSSVHALLEILHVTLLQVTCKYR